MPTLLSDAKTAIRERLYEPIAAQWTDVELVRWINEAIANVARDTEFYKQTFTVAAVIGQSEYTITWPYTRATRCEFLPTGSTYVYPMEFREFNNMDEVWGQYRGTSSTPRWFTIWGAPTVAAPSTRTFVAFPAPAMAGNFKVYAYGVPAVLVNTTDDAKALQIPEGWADLIYDYVEFKALRRDRDPRWQEAKLQYDTNLARMKMIVESDSDQPGQFTQWRGRMGVQDYDPYGW